MSDHLGGLVLPHASRAERTVPAASSAHCTAHAVLGENDGVRFQAESHLELCHLHLLNAMREVVEMREQACFLYGFDPERTSRHVFDVLATLACGMRIAFAVKPEIRLLSGRFVEEMGRIAWWVRELGFADETRILTEADIDPVSLRNAEILAAVREPDPEADAVALGVVRALPDGGGRTLRDLTLETGMAARGYRALIRLVRCGVMRLQTHEVIGPGTMIVNAATPATAFRSSAGDGRRTRPGLVRDMARDR